MTARLHHPHRSTEVLDATGERLAKRMALLLSEHRRQHGLSVRSVARSTGGRYAARDLRRIEAGRTVLSPEHATELAELYGIDLTTALPVRAPIEIRPFGVLSANGVARSFTPGDDTSLMNAYIELIRAIRDDDTTHLLDLRRSDIDLLAEHLAIPGDLVVERLAGLMGAPLVQRRAMARMFMTGALVISLGAAVPAVDMAADADAAVARSAAPTTPTRMRTTTRSSPWATSAMIDRAGHRQLLRPVFSWSPPSPPMDAPRGGMQAQAAADQSIEPIWVPTS
jgi:transcriptional regulator with XRE-family HTH domain